MENLSLVYNHSQWKTVPGYEVLTLGVLTPQIFLLLNFGYHFSHTVPEGTREAQARKTKGNLARLLKEGKELTKRPWP